MSSKVDKLEKRAIMGIFGNWHNYEPLLGTDYESVRIIPFNGKFFSTVALSEALESVDDGKKISFEKFVMEGSSQSEVSRGKGVTQAMVWFEIDRACMQISDYLKATSNGGNSS